MWPITLTESNLGKRHLQLNLMVNDAFHKRVPFEDFQFKHEASPVDRLFKIDLASKYRNVDYIIENLKNEDLLYVSRALKCTWLLDSEYENIITPQWLENQLFPSMTTTAVKKMKNWLYLHLKDELRNQKFYNFYKDKNFDYAMKFLGHCTENFISNEVSEIAERLSPQNLKIICEKSPKAAEIYFTVIRSDDNILSKFLEKERAYYHSLKVVLKLAPNVFFQISEDIFEKKYSPLQTKYIMKHHRDKFDRKPELYTASLLHLKTLAQCLSAEECKEVILKLARAKYLEYWFTYKNVEPLIKRMKPEERPAFKKQVFVKKDVGPLVEEWPYAIPALPKQPSYLNGIHVFQDKEHSQHVCKSQLLGMKKRKIVKKCARRLNDECDVMYCESMKVKTVLDKLFDEYRFASFSKTLFELRKRIKAESSYKNREFMLLVLVSKTGGKPECIAPLLELLTQHNNEPVNLKAAVVRSLVKRAAVWRLPQEMWDSLLEFARGLGLDGAEPEADCHEGLHAVVLRQLLNNAVVDEPVREAFFKNFSLFDEYSLNPEERKFVSERLPNFILATVDVESDPLVRADRLTLLFDTLKAYKVMVDSSPLIPAVICLAKIEFSAAKPLLNRLYDARIGRRILFRENFNLRHTDASYLNALRHDISVLDIEKLGELVFNGELRIEKFLRKISIYFSEETGLADVCLANLKHRLSKNQELMQSVARPLCILQGADLAFLRSLDVTQDHIARLAAAIKANMHVGRYKLHLNETDLKEIGAKAAANKLLTCPAQDIDKNVQLLLQSKNTVRIALILSERNGKEANAYKEAVKLKPIGTIKTALKYFNRKGDSLDLSVWESIKPVLGTTNISLDTRTYFRKYLLTIKRIPLKIKAEYCSILYNVFKADFREKATSLLCCIEHLIFDANEDFIESTLVEFFNNFETSGYEIQDIFQRIRLTVKYLLLSKDEETQNKRFENFGVPLLNLLKTATTSAQLGTLTELLEEVLFAIRYHKVLLEPSYQSPIPILTRIVTWMRENLPLEKNFNWFVNIHLTMMYSKAIREVVLTHPDAFKDRKRMLSEGVDKVGNLFGKYIAEETRELMANYFPSILEIYRSGLEAYFNDYFQYDTSKRRLALAMTNGILDGSKGAEAKLAAYFLKDEYYVLETGEAKSVIEIMRQIEHLETKFFVFAELLSK